MGGGVALELYRLAPERVASLVLLSSIGVQEMELLGDYSLNHVVHGLQLVALGATRVQSVADLAPRDLRLFPPEAAGSGGPRKDD